MRFSEAIRLGATMKPQTFDRFFDGVGTCAIGAAYDAIGDLGLDTEEWADAVARFDSVACPECGRDRLAILELSGTARNVVTHLNDFHRWTRERIADFVELHEPLPIPEPPMKTTTSQPSRTIQSYLAQGYVKHYVQHNLAATERCRQVACPHCCHEGMRYVALRWESGQVWDFAECAACGYAAELYDIERENRFPVCENCGEPSDDLVPMRDQDRSVGYDATSLLCLCCRRMLCNGHLGAEERA